MMTNLKKWTELVIRWQIPPEDGSYNARKMRNEIFTLFLRFNDFKIKHRKSLNLIQYLKRIFFFNVGVGFYLLNSWIHIILPFLKLKQMDQENWAHLAILFYQPDTLKASTSGAQHHGTFPHNILTLTHHLEGKRVWGLLSTENFSNESQLCEHLC